MLRDNGIDTAEKGGSKHVKNQIPKPAYWGDPQTLLLPLMTSKRELHIMATATSKPSKKFSVASHDMKFVFASFLMIISISQSKRGGRTTLRSDSIGAKVSKWSFFKNHGH